LQALGVPAPHFMGWLTILVEIFGGLAVLLGPLVPLASIPMAAVLLVAIVTVHLPYGFSSIKLQAVTAAGAQFGPPGFETDLLYLACLAALLLRRRLKSTRSQTDCARMRWRATLRCSRRGSSALGQERCNLEMRKRCKMSNATSLLRRVTEDNSSYNQNSASQNR
jgi:hypothetical protein